MTSAFGKPEAAILELDQDWYGSDCEIPGIWITRLVKKSDGRLRREHVDLYPTGGPCDPDGSLAFAYGAEYYEEAMSYVDAADHERRIECFQAAEILYLNAAKKGNVQAICCLGYVYSYNRCEGRFFQDYRQAETEEDYRKKVDYQARAFECFKRAAEYGLFEAFYKLGDMYEKGIGCQEDPSEAVHWFTRAYGESSRYDTYARGGAALRLGRCHEVGYGCCRDVARALSLYEEAAQCLNLIVSSGDWFYEKSLTLAESGVARMRQEYACGV